MMLEKIAIWFLLFMLYSFAGWLMEVCISLINHKKFVNRGFLVGPICPIYGTGAVLISLLLNQTESPLAIFCVALVGGAVLEYSASFIMEKLFRVRWWDYSEKSVNINGRICMSSVLSFGLAGILIVEVTTPFFYNLFDSLYSPLLLLAAAILFAWLICDILLSLWLILGVRVTVGATQPDATEEISRRVQKVLAGNNNKVKKKLNNRLEKAFPNKQPSKRHHTNMQEKSK